MTLSVFENMAVDLFNAIGEAATFTPATGDPVTLQVNVETEIEMQPGSYETNAFDTVSTVEYLLSDIGREANRGETFLVDGTTYTVQSTLENDGYTARAIVK